MSQIVASRQGCQRLCQNAIKGSLSAFGERIVIVIRAKRRFQLSANASEQWSIHQQIVTDCARQNCRLTVTAKTLIVSNNA